MKVQFAKAGSKRVPHDFYATPPEATVAILPLIADWPQPIWAPMCGTGAMSEVLIAAGKEVISSDPFPQGYGEVGKLFADYTDCPCPTMIENPPFNKAAAIIEHAHAIGITHLALLLKAQFWHAKSRIGLFEKHPPAWALPLTWRLDWDGRKSPTMDCTWFLWTPGTVETRVALLSKPITVPQSRDPVRLPATQASLVPLLDAATLSGDSELDSLMGLAPTPALSQSEMDEAALQLPEAERCAYWCDPERLERLNEAYKKAHANDPPIMGRKVPGEGNSGRAGMTQAAEDYYAGKGTPR